MKKNICLIDDQFPAEHYPEFIDETKKIEESALKYLAKRHDGWPEEALKSLIDRLLEEHSDWSLSAFKNPNFYFNHIQSEIFSPDIIIFDWDYGAGTSDSDEHLLKIAKSTYSYIAIYTGADETENVSNIVNDEKFKDYRHRISIIKKSDTNAVEEVISECNEKFQNNFSFKMGQQLKYHSIKSLDEILIEISKISYNEFVCVFGHSSDNKSTITIKEFVEIIGEKFKNYLAHSEFNEEIITVEKCSESLNNDIARLWSYRMFYSPKDDIIRTGDIIKMKESSDEYTRYLVVSSDCHIQKFWSKNFGSLALIPLYEKNNANQILKQKLNYFSSLGSYKGASSIANKWNSESLSVIACVPCQVDDKIIYKDFIAFPKEIFTLSFDPPSHLDLKKDIGEVRNLQLIYSLCQQIEASNRVNINEPFKSPLIQFLISNITGFGAPDYPAGIKKSIENNKLTDEI